MKYLLIFSGVLCLPYSCNYMAQGPHKGYQETHDEALPACQMRSAIYRGRR